LFDDMSLRDVVAHPRSQLFVHPDLKLLPPILRLLPYFSVMKENSVQVVFEFELSFEF
jgi:hypothetical protein